MKKMKRVKLLVATLAAASIGCLAWGAAILPQKDVALASTELAVTVASEADYFVYGGSVRVTDAKYGPGVKYHVAMTAAEFDKYGTIGERMGTLDSGYTTGTLLLPTSFLGDKDLVRDGNYGVTLSDSDTSAVWKKTTIGGEDYMESVIYLYNIPETDYGTDMSLRGYIYNESEGSIVYTEQVDGMSMSFVAKAECGNANTELTEDELNTLKTTYVDKTITYHIGDTTETATVEYLKTATKKAAASRQDDNDEFVGWYTKQGNEFDFSTPIKNNVHVYAHYRESIVLSSLDSTQAIKNFRADTYKRAETDTISSMVLNLGGNEHNLGNNPDAVDVTGFESNLEQHGEGTVTVTYQRADSSSYTLELPALVVTRDITTLAEIGHQTRITGETGDDGINSNAKTSTSFIFKTSNYAAADCGSNDVSAEAAAAACLHGYYRLAKDLGYWVSGGDFAFAIWQNDFVAFANSVGLSWNNAGAYNHPLQGFRGTFDGAGHAIYGQTYPKGMFGQIGQGAVIKDLEIAALGYRNAAASSVLAGTIINASLENIYIHTVGENVFGGATSSEIVHTFTTDADGKEVVGTTSQQIGILTSTGASGTSFKNVTINGVNSAISYTNHFISIFGGHYWSGGYEELGNKQNTYENFKIYAGSVGAMGFGLNKGTTTTLVDTEGKTNVTVTVQAEIDEGNDITFIAGAAPETETETLTTRQAVVISDSSTWKLDIGEYAAMEIVDIAYGNTSFGTNPNALAIPEAFKTDLQNHGDQNVTVTIKKLGVNLKLTVPVTFVTEDIYTKERFVEIFTYPTAQAYYGYYRLADDIGDQNWSFNASGRGSANCEWRSYGFRGTFDGNGHTITGVAAQGGLFGWIGIGAVIKNVNILDYGTVSGSHRSTLASTISMATLENVHVTVCTTVGIKAPTDNQQANGLLASQWCYGTTLTDVTVDAGLNEVYALFGACSYAGYEHYTTDSTPTEAKNAYENVVVNAGALSYIGYWYDSTVSTYGTFYGITEEDGFTFNKVEKDLGTVRLETSTDIVLGGSTARNDLDLGDYNNWTVNSVGDGFAYADGKLTVPETIANDKKKHGEYTVTFGLTNDIGQTATLLVPIIVVTQEITTTAEWADLFSYEPCDMTGEGTIAENEGGLFGYYTLGNNIGNGGGSMWTFASSTGTTCGTPEYRAYGFRGTLDGRDKQITHRQYSNGLFGWIGNDAVIKNLNILDVYWSSVAEEQYGYHSVLAATIANATIENVNITFQPYGAAARVPSETEANLTYPRHGWLAYQWCFGTTFKNVTLTANKDSTGADASYGIGSLFGAVTWGSYESVSQNTYDGLYINIGEGKLHSLGIKYDSATKTYSAISVQDEVSDNDGQNDIIYVNGEKVLPTLDENPAFAEQTVILNGANTNVTYTGGAATASLDLEDYTNYVTAMTWKNDDGNEVALTYDKASKSYTIPSAYISGEGLAMHGEGEILVDITFNAQEFTFSVPLKVVTLEITTAAQLATFLRNYASVANNEEFNGYTAAGQSSSGLTFRWEGTNIYDGYFTLGADIDYSTHTNEDKRFNVYQHCYNPYDEGTNVVKGAYWYPMDIELATGNEEKGFRGTFDGQGHTISDFAVYNYKAGTGQSTSGLISKLTAEGVIRNVGFVNAKAYYGAIVSSWGHGTIENIYLKYSPSIIEGSVNTHNYVVGIDGASALNAVGEQLAYIKDSIIDVSALSTADTYGAYLGFTKNDYTNIENVIFYGGIADGAGIAYYPGNASGVQGVYNMPLGTDSFTHYTNVGELVRNHKAAINGWDSAFEAKSDGVYFNGTKVLSGTEAAAPQTNYLVNTDKTGSDYVLVYDENNATVSKLATYLIDQIRRASGTVDYYESTNSTTGAVITQGIFEELVTGGVTLQKLSNVAWSESARYIVLGDMDLAKSAGVSIPDGYDYTIQWYCNSLFILASSDDGYNPAVNRFLEEAIGFRGLSDSYSSYDDVAGKVLSDSIPWTMNGNITFHSRSQTGFNNSLKREIKAINGYGFFSSAGPVQEDGTIRSTHNAMYWLPNNTTMYPVSTTGESTLPAGYATNGNWYSTHTRDNGTYTGYDLCYTARNTKSSSDGVYTANDSSAYDQMVYWTAQHMLSVLNRLDPAKDAEKEILTFGCMDDVTVYYACTCSGCSSKTGGAATTLIVDFLNRVLGLVLAEREDVILYMLGYYYLEDPEGVTVQYPDNFGVIYAPISRPTTAQGGTEAVETKSIYDAANDEVRARIADWASKVKHMAFWFYDTLYSNFMMPMDTYRSMLTWMEYAARTCQDKNVNVGWFTVNGQSSVYNPTGFADFKTYLVQKAEIEILEKVTVSGSDEQIDAYLTELENEFFGRNTDGSFNDKGYYGPAAANEAMYNFYKQMCTDYQNKVTAGTSTGRVVDDILTKVTCSYTVNYTYTYTSIGQWAESSTQTGSATGTSTITFDKWVSGAVSALTSDATTVGKNSISHKDELGYSLKTFNITSITINSTAMTNWSTAEVNYYLQQCEAAWTAVTNCSLADKDIFFRNILQETLFPRFVVCMGSVGYSHGGSILTSTDATTVRKEFQANFAELGNDRYSEHSYMSAVYSVWGI